MGYEAVNKRGMGPTGALHGDSWILARWYDNIENGQHGRDEIVGLAQVDQLRPQNPLFSRVGGDFFPLHLGFNF